MRHALVRALLLTVIVVSTTGGHALAQRNQARIVEVPGAPLEIATYEARYTSLPPDQTGVIEHTVTLRNIAGQEVVAFGIGFASFDAFNRYMGRPFTGVTIATPSLAIDGRTEEMVWTQARSDAFTFRRYGLGVAYVSLVRLVDGTIWEADLDYVLDQLQEIEGSLTLEDLDEE